MSFKSHKGDDYDRSRARRLTCILFIASLLLLAWDAPIIMGQEEVSISGVTEAIKDVTLSLSVAGTVSSIFVKEGSTVKRGQVILELDKKLEELEVARRKLIWESKTELVAAMARVLTMKFKLESTQKLFETTRSVSREELEEKELEHKLAVAEKDQLEIEEQRQRIEYEMALETLKKRRLVSPISGMVIKLFLDKGESSEPEQPLVHVVDTSRCLLVSNMEEPLGRTLKKGQSVTMRIRTGSELITKQGIIAFVSPVVDPASGLLEVKAAFKNQDRSVRPGVEGFLILNAP